MIQAARNAHAKREAEELVLACLFHDIGHLLAPDDTEGHGVANHAALGAGLLQGLGLSDRTCGAVNHHVNAKRYLVGSDPFYELTPASRITLGFQGGPMTCAQERYMFREHPAFEDAMAVREFDDTAKTDMLSGSDVGKAFDEFAPMILKHVGK
jgi:predicted HD phosphohydrolase